jgi:hypothetical protein
MVYSYFLLRWPNEIKKLCYEDIWVSGGIAPPILTSTLDESEWWASCLGRFTPGERDTVRIGEEVGWAPEPVWTVWRREKFCPYLESNPGHPAHCYTYWAIPAHMQLFHSVHLKHFFFYSCKCGATAEHLSLTAPKHRTVNGLSLER